MHASFPCSAELVEYRVTVAALVPFLDKAFL